MINTELPLDLLRVAHLLGVTLGMGSAAYLDLRTLSRMAQPISHSDLDELHRIHKIVTVAFASLWVSGLCLIWIRTGFQLEAFSPKLWSKICIVTTLTVNSVILSAFVVPVMNRFEGSYLIDLPTRLLLPVSVVAGISMSCWLMALMLGASTILKTSNWDDLVMLMSCGLALGIGGVVAMMFGLRVRSR